MDYAEEIKEFYNEFGLIGRDGRNLSLHRSCRYRRGCWNADETPHNRYSGMIFPHIGKKYEETGLVVIGINNRANHDNNNPNAHSDEIEIHRQAQEIRREGRISVPAFQTTSELSKHFPHGSTLKAIPGRKGWQT